MMQQRAQPAPQSSSSRTYEVSCWTAGLLLRAPCVTAPAVRTIGCRKLHGGRRHQCTIQRCFSCYMHAVTAAALQCCSKIAHD
jgi:hypothetical protein